MTDVTYDWAISNMERNATTGVIRCADWTLTATQSGQSVAAFGSVGVNPPGDPVPFGELTEELVIGWVQDSLGEDQINGLKEALAAQLAERVAPVSISGVPWAPPAE